MTIYTDQETGKQYDRVQQGVTKNGHTTGAVGCRGCAFNSDSDGCHRASRYCNSIAPPTVVMFIMKERNDS